MGTGWNHHWIESLYIQSRVRTLFLQILYSSSWTCANYVSIFYLFFFFSNKKASKTRADMQGIHEGTGAMLLPNSSCCRPPPPLFLCYCICPQPKFSSMYPLHCHVLPPPCASCLFFFFCWVITLHTDAIVPKVLSKSKRSHLQLLRWLFFMDVYMCLCVFSPPLCVDSNGVFSFSFCFSLLYVF